MIGLFSVAGQAHALTKYQSSTRGNQASASEWSYDSCSSEGVSIWAFEQNQRGSKTANNSVYIDYYRYDSCTGTDTWGSASIDGAAFNQRRLDGASLTGSATMTVTTCTYTGGGGGGSDAGVDGGMGGGYDCSSVDVPVSINIAWTGTGDTSKDRYSSAYSTPHSRYRYRSTGQSRDATLSGTVSIDSSNVDMSTGYGSLSIQSSGSFEMYK
jgi:hypothetical protein